MSGLKSVVFGDIQYQVSEPIQNPSDGYYYQRSRQITREGSVESEFIFRSFTPDSKSGLVDPERGFDLAYGFAVSVYDLAAATYRIINVGSNLMSGVQLERAINKLVKDGVEGIEYPEGLKVGYKSWSGTDAPWDSSTLKSDPAPQWAPGPIEQLFVSTLSSNQADKYSNLAGVTVVNRVPDGDGGRTITADAGSGFTVIFHERADGLVDKVVTRDPLGKETTEDNWQLNGNLLRKYNDTQNYHPYDKLDVSENGAGQVTAAQVVLDPDVLAAGMSIGQIFGSAIGGALGGNSLVGHLTGSAIGGLVGQKFVQVLAISMTTDLSKVSLNDVFAGQGISVANAGIGVISSFLTAELGHALHLDGFDGQLFNTAVSGFTTSLLIQVKDEMARGSLDFAGAIAAMDWTQAVSGAIDAAQLNIGNLLGSYLGHELVPAQTREGAIGGQLLGAIVRRNANRRALRRNRGKSRHASRQPLPAFLASERTTRNARINPTACIRQHCA